jgi:tyrosinase
MAVLAAVLHVAVGGYDVPNRRLHRYRGPMAAWVKTTPPVMIPSSFHHCFVDRIFWLWQKRHGFTDELEVMPEFPSTNSVDG